MFILKSSSIDFSVSSSLSFQLSDFTSANGSLSKSKSVKVSKTSSVQGTDPFSFTKLYAGKVQGGLDLAIDLTNINVIGSCSPTTLTPKGFFIYTEYDSSSTSGVVVFKKDSIDGYAGCYNLLTNEYKTGLNYAPLLLIGEVGSAPGSSNRLLRLATISGQEPQNTYIIIWGD
jgi:hypothetical protein